MRRVRRTVPRSVATTFSRCAFCGATSPGMAVGLAAAICLECVETLHGGDRPVLVEELSDRDLLEVLPVIEEITAEQRARIHEWVRQLRRRRITWREIAESLGVSRQTAWARFGPSSR